jgi:hypothetical protein
MLGSACALDRYAFDVNIERVEDILLHKRLLEEAREPMNGLVFDVRHSQLTEALKLIQQLPLRKRNKILNAQLLHQAIKGLCMKLYLHVMISQSVLVS